MIINKCLIFFIIYFIKLAFRCGHYLKYEFYNQGLQQRHILIRFQCGRYQTLIILVAVLDFYFLLYNLLRYTGIAAHEVFYQPVFLKIKVGN